MKYLVRVRDEDTGVGEAGVNVTFRRLNGGATVGTDTTDADGVAELVANGCPGRTEWTATHAGQTRTVAGDLSIQTGPVYTGEFDKLLLIFGDGVVSGGDSGLAVVEPGGGGRNVDVGTGLAFVKGIPYIGHTLETLAIGANVSGNPRIDRVVVRVTRTGADIYAADVVVVAGTPAGSPVPPALTQTADTWEISLAQVAVANGAASILTANITDERTYAPGTTLDNSISTAKLQDDAVTVAKLSTGADLSTAEIAKVLKAPTSGNNPSYAVLNLGELNDVLTTSPTTGQVLQWNGTAWAPATTGAGLTVSEGGTPFDTDITTLDFDANAFVLSESPENEINISPQFGSGATNIAQGNHTHDTIPEHAHTRAASARGNLSRDEVASGLANITSTTGQHGSSGLFADITLENGVTYDIDVDGTASIQAGAGQNIYMGAAVDTLDALGGGVIASAFNGEGTETATKPHGGHLSTAVIGNGGAIRCGLWFKVSGGTGFVGSAAGKVMAIPRDSGGVD